MESRAKRVVSSDQADLLRQIPSVDELLAQPRLAALAQRVNRELLVEITRTNLGRAPLSGAALEEIRRSATSYSNLEYDLEAGARGKRDVHIAELLERLTGAEAAIVVNNCAAAVLLVLAGLAKGGG